MFSSISIDIYLSSSSWKSSFFCGL